MSEGEANYTLLRSAGYEITAEQIDALTTEQADALDYYLSDLVSPKRRDAANAPEWLSAYAIKQAA